jgi:hypothetical protein
MTAGEAVYEDAMAGPSPNVLQLWREVGNHLDKSQTGTSLRVFSVARVGSCIETICESFAVQRDTRIESRVV